MQKRTTWNTGGKETIFPEYMCDKSIDYRLKPSLERILKEKGFEVIIVDASPVVAPRAKGDLAIRFTVSGHTQDTLKLLPEALAQLSTIDGAPRSISATGQLGIFLSHFAPDPQKLGMA